MSVWGRPSVESPAVIVENVHKSYRIGERVVEVLRGVNLRVERGEFLSILGPSGSGKTTLLFLIGGLDVPDRGSITVFGERISEMSEGERTRWRRRNLGIVFQFYHLIPTLTAIENVMLPMELAGLPRREWRSRALKLLDLVGCRDLADKFPSQLSGGEQQRIALARALAADPPLVLADEPTANLDTANKVRVVRLLRDISRRGHTVVLVTHDEGLAGHADRIVRLVDGVIVEEARPQKSPGSQRLSG